MSWILRNKVESGYEPSQEEHVSGMPKIHAHSQPDLNEFYGTDNTQMASMPHKTLMLHH